MSDRCSLRRPRPLSLPAPRRAEAGRGLPAIEPGMPLPAGTGLSRSSFLAHGLGAMLAVYGSSKLGFAAFEEGIAAAAAGRRNPCS